ncbi:hydroxypyruvate isomerase [Mesobacillus persicus]|uniref:Hydroxypyruvate isomerase n=1 Tax=Mesobacillus persicus TaxID=930146 RepID=A0A1H7WGB0_9BACI|nr:TIM barrel protein [Mesobacillus persicus]SEM20125.1 hydroxypyruvate isomerase [Mesobacillus persicus]
MNKLVVNLSTVFLEVPFIERFKKARESGFSSVECQFPYAHTTKEIVQEMERNQLSMVLLNLPPGDWEQGDRGLATDPSRVDAFKKSVRQGIKYATALNVPRIHCMAGIVSEANREHAKEVYVSNLYYAGSELAKYDLTLLIEPINPYNMPDYFLNNLHQAAGIIKEVNLPNVALQFDFYHIERIHGNSLSLYDQYTDIIGHVQIADTPSRHEPGTGEIDYQQVFGHLKNTYKGYIGLEYTPKGRSEDSFEWLTTMKKGSEWI